MSKAPDKSIEQIVAELLEASDDHAQALTVLENAFQQMSDAEYLEGMKRTVPGAARLYGVRVPQLRALAREIARHYKRDSDALAELAAFVWNDGSREHQLLAVFMLGRAKLTPEGRWELGTSFLPDVDNWETCDQLCHALLGEALARDPAYMAVLETWLDHENFWQRRAALVSTVLLRRYKGPSQEGEDLDRRALAMCEALLEDPEPYIAKAVDWTVREVIKRHPDLGAAWMLAQAEKNLSAKARSTLKKSAKKLTPEEQTRFLELLAANA